MKTLRPLFFFSSLLLIVGLACSALGGGDTPPAQPQQPVQVQPTQPPAPVVTEAPPTEAPVATNTTSAPEPPVSQFFTEEFDRDPGSDWAVDILGPGADAHKDSVVTEYSDGKFRIELPEQDLYYYYTYSGFSYDNVRLDLRADNRGVNTNNISLF